MKKLVYLLLLFSFDVNAQTITNIIGPKNYYVTSKSGTHYSEGFTRTQAQLNPQAFQYKLILKNADGVAHPVKDCSHLKVLKKLICEGKNLIIQTYVKHFRIQSATISLNGQVVTNVTNFNQDTLTLEVPLHLSNSNTLNIDLQGPVLSYINLQLISTENPLPQDTSPPVLMANIQSGAITNNPMFAITIQDASNVTTEVYQNGVLMSTQTSKYFELYLQESVNNYVFKSHDEYGNQASDFTLSNIVLDTKSPIVSLDIPNQYFVKAAGAQITIPVESNEPLQILKINDQPITTTEGTTYSYTYTVQPTDGMQSIQTLHVWALDLAGNLTEAFYNLNIILDTEPPVINLGSLPNFTIQSNLMVSVQISDISPVKTELYLNDQYVTSVFNTNNFSYNLDLGSDGSKNIKVVATDEAGNTATQTSVVVKNTQPFEIQVLSPISGNMYKTSTLSFKLKSTVPLSHVNVNNQDVPISSDGLSVNFTFESWPVGVSNFTVYAESIFGNSITRYMQVEVQPNGITSWSYAECTVE